MTMTEFETPDHAVITASIEVHRNLGPGLLESTYSQCLIYELAERGVPFLIEPFVSIKYKKLGIERAFRADLIVADRLIVEIKHVEKILAIHGFNSLEDFRGSRRDRVVLQSQIRRPSDSEYAGGYEGVEGYASPETTQATA